MAKIFVGDGWVSGDLRVLRMRPIPMLTPVIDFADRHLMKVSRLVQKVPVQELNYELLPVGDVCFVGAESAEVTYMGTKKQVTVSESPTLEKIAFLKGLNPTKVLVGYYGPTTRRARYFGFLFETKSDKIAVVSADRTENADYLFRASDPEWESLLEQPKSAVLKSGHPAFIGRVVHQGNWRGRIECHLH